MRSDSSLHHDQIVDGLSSSPVVDPLRSRDSSVLPHRPVERGGGSLHHPDGPDPDRDNWHRHDGEPRYPELMECEGQLDLWVELGKGE